MSKRRAKKSGVSNKIAKLVREGKTPEQAAGEAYGMEREGRLTHAGGYIRSSAKRRRRKGSRT